MGILAEVKGFRCLMYAYLHADNGAAVMTNSDNGIKSAKEIIYAVAQEYGRKDFVTERLF